MHLDLSDAIAILSRHVKPDGFDASAILADLRANDRTRPLEHALARAMTEGTLTEAWEAGKPLGDCTDFAPALGRLWDGFCELGFQSAEGCPNTWTFPSFRLWAYAWEWALLSQDEDLLLMQENFIPWLLAIAAEPDCPKSGYGLQVVAHWARDGAFYEVGKPGFAAFVRKASAHEQAARTAGDLRLADYLARLGSYADPHAVDEAAAMQRGLDLTRCYEPSPDAVAVTRQGDAWRVTLPGAKGSGPGTTSLHSKQLRIAVVDGAMSVL
jgi:hypothetical protein